MRPRAASSAGHSDTSRPAADVRTSSSLFQVRYQSTAIQSHTLTTGVTVDVDRSGQGIQILQESLRFRKGQEEQFRYMPVQK